MTPRHRSAHKSCQNSAHRRTSGIKSSTDVLSLSAVSQQRYVEWRNSACVRQQAVISPFWSAGRQQQCDDTALARRAACPTAWRYIGLIPPLFPADSPKLRLHARRHLCGLVIFWSEKTATDGFISDIQLLIRSHMLTVSVTMFWGFGTLQCQPADLWVLINLSHFSRIGPTKDPGIHGHISLHNQAL